MKSKQYTVVGKSDSRWILPRTFKRTHAPKGCTVVDLSTNGGEGKLPSNAMGKFTGSKKAHMTCYSSDFGEAIHSAKTSGLRTCGGLIVAVRPKKSGGNFSQFIAYHWSGSLVKDVVKEEENAEAWKELIIKAQPTIRVFIGEGYAHGACIAGPRHPNSRSDFEKPFESMATNLNFQQLHSFWTRSDEEAQTYRGPSHPASLELFKEGKLVVQHSSGY